MAESILPIIIQSAPTRRSAAGLATSLPSNAAASARRARATRLATVPAGIPNTSGRVGVGQAVDRDQHQRRPLVRRQLGDEAAHIGQSSSLACDRALAVGPTNVSGSTGSPRPPRTAACRCRLIQMLCAILNTQLWNRVPGSHCQMAFERTLVDRLDQIVGLIQRAGQAGREAAQPRSQRQQCLPSRLLRPGLVALHDPTVPPRRRRAPRTAPTGGHYRNRPG